MPASVFPASASLNVISSLPLLSEPLLSSLSELDEELPLSRELADPSKSEILPDSELDEEEVSAAASASASTTTGEVGRTSQFDGEPLSSIAFAGCLTRAIPKSFNLKIYSIRKEMNSVHTS
jgi:hypothetical protein